ncbi:hypothetical protein CKO38_02685 [Rhodospirillum rubrum]|uniref:hypothetical protein n=1 Tax=Rhodospirillum rubrum TaxID=1085 RepID=UPI001906C11D|nr:hypothetical protein [Rhodospirillum rubrum]MBK1664122.1 hypothetical protein [Rhodospirillum rubrum]MBK1675597.1 hypothetical protein [Rhodospirillum rubrum]
MLFLTSAKAATVRAALDHWAGQGLLAPDEAARLSASITVQTVDWRRLSRYAFWAAVACLIVSLGALAEDSRVMALLVRLFTFGPAQRFIGFALAAGAFFAYGVYRHRARPQTAFRNEAILFLGVVATAASLVNLGLWLDSGKDRDDLLFLLASLIYGVIALGLRSVLVWVFTLIALACWMVAFTGIVSGWENYYLGLNWPLRFVLFSAAIVALAVPMARGARLAAFSRPTLSLGLLYLFLSLWLLSIFGNYGDLEEWRTVSQLGMIPWSVLFAAVAVAAIWIGVRRDDGMLRGYGLIFLGLNIYTRFFEVFWTSLHKGIFFALLGVSLWLLGTRAEKLWTLGRGR